MQHNVEKSRHEQASMSFVSSERADSQRVLSWLHQWAVAVAVLGVALVG